MKRRSLFTTFATLILGWSLATAASASPIEVELVSAQQGVRPGEAFYVGVHLKPKKHYHTYYKHPGIVGVATGMKWNLPEGWRAEEIEWPEPKLVMMFTVRAQGYHGEMVLPIKVHPPKNLQPGSEVTLKGKATWMCCYRDCNPGSQEISITLPVDAGKAAKSTKFAKLFAEARTKTPDALTDYRASAKTVGKQVILTLTPVSDQALGFKDAFFITENELIDPSQPQELEWKENGALVMKLPISEYASKPIPTKLEGLLQIDKPWKAGTESTSARFSAKLQ